MDDTLIQSKVLIVDDMRENIDVLRNILGDYVRMVALNGTQAIGIATSKNPPDLILLDIMMPDMDGYEVCRQLKAHPNTVDIPVIFLTAKTSVPDESKGFALGAVDYITKPISPPIVLARVKTHLQLKHSMETLKIQNTTINQQYTELAEASKFREDVKYIMQQDLKTPLNEIISGINSIYMSRRPSEQEANQFYTILKSANQLLTMINASIEMYKIEHKDYVLQPKPINLLPIILDIIKFEDKKLKMNATTIKILLNGRSPQLGENYFVLGEELLYYSMLTNLIQCASDASDSKESILIFLEGSDPSILKISYKTKTPLTNNDDFFQKYLSNGDHKRLGPYTAKMIAEIQNGTIQIETSNKNIINIIIRLPTAWLEGINLYR
ncbi:MAG: response regulator [Magnetococcus sp. YQC-5]